MKHNCEAEHAAISGVLATRELDVRFPYAVAPESLRAPDLSGIFGFSLRCFTKNPG